MLFFFRESLPWLLGCAIIGYFIGRAKGYPRQGFLLGFACGPIGWGIVMLFPRNGRGFSAPSGRACPRCRKRVGAGDKACPHCGNVLVTVNYRVEGKS